MTRPIFIGNGRMLVGLNDRGLVHDFYFPYVGLENHTKSNTLPHKIGVWVDGQFSWIDDGTWETSMRYEVDAQIGLTKLHSPSLRIRVEMRDFVMFERNVFYRSISIKNEAETTREVRLFMHQLFRIAESSRGDTALFLPDENAILDYKGNRAFVISGKRDGRQGFDEHSIGNFGIEGKEGTFRDAEDGSLGGNNVEHGHVDSVGGFYETIEPGVSKHISYWIAAATTNTDAIRLHEETSRMSAKKLIKEQKDHWRDWLKPYKEISQSIKIDDYQKRLTDSLLIMKSHMDSRGAVIASGDSKMLNYSRDYYSYFWPRDGAYVVSPLIRLGYTKEPEGFFNICRDVLDEDGYLHHKYLPDRSLGSSWHPYIYDHHRELPIQEDETAITIFMLGEYAKARNDYSYAETLYTTLIKPAADFMAEFFDKETNMPHASYELWEMYFLTSTYSVSVVDAALHHAIDFAGRFSHPEHAIEWEKARKKIHEGFTNTFFNQDRGYFNRGFLLREGGMQHDEVIDVASLYGPVRYGMLAPNHVLVDRSLETLRNGLLKSAPVGGLPRFEHDPYYKCDPPHMGNPWFVTTLWYAQILIARGEKEEAESWVRWATEKMLESGVLPEQISPSTGDHKSVSPLIWSHAEYVNTLLDLYTGPRF